MDQLLWETPKAGGKVIRAKLTSYKGSAPYLDMREWYAAADGDLRAGKGCTIPLDRMAELHGALGQWLSQQETGK
jgi:Transcriptional Coactivator p15 (PC4)